VSHWLLVEDEVDIRNVVKVMFQVWGHQAIEFSNGNDAFDYLEDVDAGDVDAADLPELALMDIRMPGPNGNEIARRIRQSPVIGKIPIILMTAFQLSEAQQNDFHNRDGVDRIIFKPLPDFDKFHSIILEVIEKRKQQNSQPAEAEDKKPEVKTEDKKPEVKTEESTPDKKA
jgi:CheY-like chemotaxis protein